MRDGRSVCDIAHPSFAAGISPNKLTGEQLSPVPLPDWEQWNWAEHSSNETVWRQMSSASRDIGQINMALSLLLLRGFKVAGHMTRHSQRNQSHILTKSTKTSTQNSKQQLPDNLQHKQRQQIYNRTSYVGHVTSAVWVGCCADEHNSSPV